MTVKTLTSFATAAILALQIPVATAANVTIQAGDIAWSYPPASYAGQDFSKGFRYKTLVGSARAPIQADGILMGEAEFAPGVIYVSHKHPAPEIYYVLQGEAEWTVGDQTFQAGSGTTIYTKPGAIHRMVNTGDGVLRAVWIWWGAPKDLGSAVIVTEPKADQPATAKFDD